MMTHTLTFGQILFIGLIFTHGMMFWVGVYYANCENRNTSSIPNIKGGYNTKPSTPKLESLKIKSPYTKCITCKNETCVKCKRKGGIKCAK